MLSDILYRLRALLRRGTVERELAEELRFHLEHQIDKYVAAGIPRAEAARRASVEFGGVEQVREACRDARGLRLVDTTLQDVRYGVRCIRRNPALALTAIATMALATAAIATVASLANTLLWQHLRVDHPDGLVTIAATRGLSRGDGAVSYPDYAEFRSRATTVSALAAHYSTAPLFVAVNGNAREVNGAVVTANYFSVLDLHPALGRFFGPGEDRVPDRDRVVVVGYDFWRSWLGSARSAIGSTLTINGAAFTVIGVAPSNPVALTPAPVELYIPTMMLRVGYRWCTDSLAADCSTLRMIGRLATGRTVSDAAAEFAAIMPPAWRSAPVGENRDVAVRQPRGMAEDEQEPRLIGALAAVAVVLLLACCANLAGLLSAQSAARETEFAIRVSLGAGPVRIVRQVVTESVLLALTGGVGGLVLSRLFIAVLARMFFSMDDEGHPLYYGFNQSWPTVLATIAAAAMAGMLFSVLPAIRAVRRPATAPPALRTMSGRWAAGRVLLAAQAAAAVAMLALAALLASSARLVLTGRNYETAHVALMRVRPRLVKYTPERAQRFQRRVIERLRGVPSVESVSMVGIGTVLGGGSTTARVPGSAGQWTVNYNEVGPAYFATLQTPMIAGREFDSRDTPESMPVAVVNETLAERAWPHGQAIGSTIVVGSTPRQIVGIVADALVTTRTQPAGLWAYTPFWQNPDEIDSRIAVRTAGDPALLLPDLAREVHRVDPDVPIAETITLPMQMAGRTRPVRVSAVFIGYAASLAMLLTAIGLYGALAFAVSRRTKEIGIRLALGAARRRVIAAIVREGASVVVAGAAAGVGLAMAGSRLLSHLLYGAAADDWMFYAAAAAVVACVGCASALLPARRAAAVEPIVALRQD